MRAPGSHQPPGHADDAIAGRRHCPAFPANPIAEIFRYVLKTPKNALGEEVYTLNDLKALQDWMLEREWRAHPGVFDISSFGGTVKRYEIHPDPERMKRYGIPLAALSAALTNSNMNVSGDFLKQGSGFKAIICRGLIGGHKDPMEHAMTLKTPEEAAAYLRAKNGGAAMRFAASSSPRSTTSPSKSTTLWWAARCLLRMP